MDESMSVDLRKLKKAPSPPVVHAVAPPPPPPVQQASPAMMRPPAPLQTAPSSVLPNAPRAGFKAREVIPVSWKQYAIWGAVALVLIVGIYYVGVTFLTGSPFGKTPENTPAQSAAAASPTVELTESQILSNVSSLMVVPQGETPVLAKVSDLSVLKDQAFFERAKVGDIVLMYQRAARAILYDPIANRIVEVGPIQNATSSVPTSN